MGSNAVNRFEQAFADWLGARWAFAFWKGRVALYAILRGMGIGEGDEVILPGYTCVMDVNPIKYVGAKPVYVDIDPATYNIAPSLIEGKITSRTKLLLAQHTYGIPCEMDAIMDIAERRGVAVVEDCCLALGSKYKGRLCGTFGLAAYWSFQWNKPFTTGIGGMVTTSDVVLAGRIDAICQKEMKAPPAKAAWMLAFQRIIYRATIFPRTTALASCIFRWLTRKGVVVGSSSRTEFQPTMAADFFTGMSAGQGRSGLRQLKKIEANLAHRRRMKSLYDELLQGTFLSMAQLPAYMDPVLVRYPVRVADKQRAVAESPGHFIELGTWFECPLHPAETPMELYDYHIGMCPVAEQACRETVNLPTHRRAGQDVARRSVEFLLALAK
jgi:perosamine synthetase